MSPRSVALAILCQQGKFLLQLRDDLPNIPYPGHWALFGGHLEALETPLEALKRELLEEIGHQVVAPQLFDCYTEDQVMRYVYFAALTETVDQLVLQEGQDLALVSPDVIGQGNCYSPKIDQIRPIGAIHQQILLEFLASQDYSKLQKV